MSDDKNRSVFDERIVQGDPEVYEVVDYPEHEEGDEGAPRDANPGDFNTRDEDESSDRDEDERDEDESL